MDQYSEGQVFAVPIRRGGGYARAVVSRVSSLDSGAIMVYLFGPKLSSLEDQTGDLCSPLHSQALKVLKCGDSGIVDGHWPLLGEITAWNRDEWQTPKFYKEILFIGKAWLVSYSEDPSIESGREPTPVGTQGYEPDGRAAPGYVEMLLTEYFEEMAAREWQG